MGSRILLTGYSSIGPGGPRRGLPPLNGAAALSAIDRWPTAGPRRAHLVPAFRPSDVVPGLKTRRMDRLSAWALVASALALQDAGLDPASLDSTRTAIVSGTAFGCLDLTEEFLGAIATNASQAPPILFPETLSNLPGSHVARHFGLRGPNFTISAGQVSGESAVLQAVSLLEAEEADRVIVLAGDTLTRALFEWYEAACQLAPECHDSAAAIAEGRRAIVPGEGLAACILETSAVTAERSPRLHGAYRGGWLGSPAGAGLMQGGVGRLLKGDAPAELRLVARAVDAAVFATASGLRLLPGLEWGDFGGSGLVQLGAALARLQQEGDGALIGAAGTDPCGQAGVILVGRAVA